MKSQGLRDAVPAAEIGWYRRLLTLVTLGLGIYVLSLAAFTLALVAAGTEGAYIGCPIELDPECRRAHWLLFLSVVGALSAAALGLAVNLMWGIYAVSGRRVRVPRTRRYRVRLADRLAVPVLAILDLGALAWLAGSAF